VNTTTDNVHQNASRVRIVNQTLMMSMRQPSSHQHVYALANLRPCTRPKATVRGSCKGRVSQLNHFDVQVQAYVCYREVETWHIRVCSWCELEFITDSTYYELVTREDCITAVNRHPTKLPSNKGIMDFAPRKNWVDTNLNVENNGALISSDFKPFKIGGAPTIFAGPGWATYHQQVNFVAIRTEITYNRALGTVLSGQHSLTGCLYQDEFCISGNYMYVWNAGKLAVRREQILSGDKAVKTSAHAHSCDGFKPTDKLTLHVVVDQDTEEITRIQVASLGYSFLTFWQCNPRIAACLNVQQDEQLACSHGRVALMLSDCIGSAKHHTFKFVQHNDTGDKEVDSFLPLFIDFTLYELSN